MNLFNRVAMSLLTVALLFLFLVLALTPDVLLGVLLSESTSSALSNAQGWLKDPLVRIGEGIGAMLLAICMLLLLGAELRPRARRSVTVSSSGRNQADLATDSVAMRVKRVAESIAGVKEAWPQIRVRGRSVEISLMLVADQDIDIPKKSEEVMQAVYGETETMMGVPIKALKITVKHSARDSRSSTPTPSAPPKAGPSR